MHKAGIAIGSAEVGWMLAATGYTANVPQQPMEVINGIKMIYFVLPIILSVVVAVIFIFYKIDYKKYDEILEEQKARGLIACEEKYRRIVDDI